MRVDPAHLDQLWSVQPLQCWSSYKASFYCTACSGDFPVTSSGSHSFMILLFSNQYLLETGNYGSKWINLFVVKAQLVLSWIRPEFCSDLWSSYQLLFYFPFTQLGCASMLHLWYLWWAQAGTHEWVQSSFETRVHLTLLSPKVKASDF